MASDNQTVKAVEIPAINSKVDLSSKARKNDTPVSKDWSTSDATSCISSVDAGSSTKDSEADQEALITEQGMYYPANGLYGYYYPGFDSSVGDWDAQGYFVGSDGLEAQHPASQADNGSVVYYFPGFQPDYNTYSPFLPGTMINVDGQYFGQQLYYPGSMYPQQFVSPGIFPQTVAYGPEMFPSYSWDTSSLVADGLYGNGYGGDRAFLSPKLSNANVPSKTPIPSKTTTISDKKGSSPALSPATQDQSFKPSNKAASVIPKGILPVNKLPSYPSQGKYQHNTNNMKEMGRSWVGAENMKARNSALGTGDFDMLSEQNRGPRTSSAKSNSDLETDSVGSIGIQGNEDNGSSTLLSRKEDYNLPGFPTKYDHALFFVIKSYSEDDIHKSIKYNVWASTPNGNKRLDNAFKVAQGKAAEKGSKCPVFLFFSVNASGQFCGVAEMIGGVDFSKNMDFWQQDKWTGFFPVKWHVIKDIPNPQFRHIILENNENKPVTNSRDTQEVKFRQGVEVLNIFKSYSSKTSILDDFSFYESRQKAMQDKRIKIPATNMEPMLQKTDDKAELGKPNELNSLVSSLQSIELSATHSVDKIPIGILANE